MPKYSEKPCPNQNLDLLELETLSPSPPVQTPPPTPPISPLTITPQKNTTILRDPSIGFSLNNLDNLLLVYGTDWTIFGFDSASSQLSIYLEGNDRQTIFSGTGLNPNSVIEQDQLKIVNTLSLAAADTSRERFIYNQENGKLFFDADGNGSIPAVEIITFPDLPSLSNSNISFFDSSFNMNNFQNDLKGKSRGKITNYIVSRSLERSGRVVLGGEGKDTLIGSMGDDQFLGFKGDDFLDGKQGNDRIHGGEGRDSLFGGQGRDRLLGGLGDDVLVGGKGSDLFILEQGGGRDIIKDYKDKEDWIGLRPNQNTLGQIIRLRDLKMIQNGRNTIVSLGNEKLATLVGVNSKQLQRSDFLLINANQGLPAHC
jgi:hypothetical protein